MGVIADHGLDVWVYRGTEWYVRDLDAPHVAHEQETVEFSPTLADDLDSLLDQAL